MEHPRRFFVRDLVVLSSFFLLLSACHTPKEASSEKADLVIRDARVYTVDPQRLWAQAVAVKGDRIVWVGDEGGVSSHIGQATRVMDAVLEGYYGGREDAFWDRAEKWPGRRKA